MNVHVCVRASCVKMCVRECVTDLFSRTTRQVLGVNAPTVNPEGKETAFCPAQWDPQNLKFSRGRLERNVLLSSLRFHT